MLEVNSFHLIFNLLKVKSFGFKQCRISISSQKDSFFIQTNKAEITENDIKFIKRSLIANFLSNEYYECIYSFLDSIGYFEFEKAEYEIDLNEFIYKYFDLFDHEKKLF